MSDVATPLASIEIATPFECNSGHFRLPLTTPKGSKPFSLRLGVLHEIKIPRRLRACGE